MDLGLNALRAYSLQLSPLMLKRSTISLVQSERSDESTCQVSPDIPGELTDLWEPEQGALYKSQALRVTERSKVAAEP